MTYTQSIYFIGDIMKRNIDLAEISDGKFYTANDLAKLGCNDCIGCSKCCENMGVSIILDPLDIHRLTIATGLTFEQLLIDKIELNIVDGVILPNIKMNQKNICPFLNEEKRCSIHEHRPGFCRIFPLARIYENNDFRYILQIHECQKEQKTKLKIKNWICTDDINKNHSFINSWHYFLLSVSQKLSAENESSIKQITMFILNMFYLTPFRKDIDFYDIFNERLKNAKSALDI